MESPRKRKSISAASIFKRRPRDSQRRGGTTKPVTVVSRSADISPVKRPHDVNFRSRKRSPRKKIPEVRAGRQKNADKHPLAVDFNETTKAYRQHLYETAVAQINETHDNLIESLYATNVKPISDPANQDGLDISSPLQLTLGSLIERQTEGMYTPIGNSVVQYHEKNGKGEGKLVKTTLGKRIDMFKVLVKKEVEEVEFLQLKWECIVGEIWKCGVQILGQEKMSELLDLSPGVAQQPEVKSTLVVPKDGDDELQLVGEVPKCKKRVSFKDDIPAFLTKPSKIIVPLQPLPDTPEQDIRELEEAVVKIGVKEVAELGTLYEMQNKWWEKKTKQLKTVWESED